jgi:hypothetical protein
MFAGKVWTKSGRPIQLGDATIRFILEDLKKVRRPFDPQ